MSRAAGRARAAYHALQRAFAATATLIDATWTRLWYRREP